MFIKDSASWYFQIKPENISYVYAHDNMQQTYKYKISVAYFPTPNTNNNVYIQVISYSSSQERDAVLQKILALRTQAENL